MIMQHRARRVSVTGDEAEAMTWYVGGPIEVALQRIVRDRITRAMDAYRTAGGARFGGRPARY
jgi:hypothetical protein